MTSHPYLMGLVRAGVGPSLTPRLHMLEARRLGLDYVYRTIDIVDHELTETDIGDVLRYAAAFGFDALNVTHPWKQSVIEHLDDLDAGAERVRAVNTVVFTQGRSIGHNTDRSGFATAMARGLGDVAKAEVVLIGAGGAGAAVADVLLADGAGSLGVVDHDAARATALCADIGSRFPDRQVRAVRPEELATVVAAADGLVNCTPMGMAAHPGLPVDGGLLEPSMWVADCVYRPLDTELLRVATSLGCRTLHGGHMAVHQAADTFRLVTGVQPDVDRMLAGFSELLDGRSGDVADESSVNGKGVR